MPDNVRADAPMSAIPPATHVTVTTTAPPGSQLDAATDTEAPPAHDCPAADRVESAAALAADRAAPGLRSIDAGAGRDRSCMGHTLRGGTLPAEVHEHQNDPEDQRNDHDERSHVRRTAFVAARPFQESEDVHWRNRSVGVIECAETEIDMPEAGRARCL